MDTISFMCGANLVERILAMSLATTWIRLIGLKSEMSSTPIFFGISTIFVEF